MNDDWDREFDRTFSKMDRRVSFMMKASVLWLVFLMGAVGTVIFLIGRWTGVW